MTNADIGKVAEARFVYEALMRGLSPALPWGNQSGYDIILTAKSCSFRVQVKSCTRRARNTYTVELRNRARKPVRSHYDFLAVWFPLESKWLIVPRSKSIGKSFLQVRIGEGVARHMDDWSIFQ